MPPAARWSRAIRVALLTDQAIVRAGVHSLLATYAERIDVVDVGGPDRDLRDVDVILYDVLGLHEGDGKDLETAVKAQPGRVLALSRELQPGLTARALAMGAIASIGMANTRMKDYLDLWVLLDREKLNRRTLARAIAAMCAR